MDRVSKNVMALLGLVVCISGLLVMAGCSGDQEAAKPPAQGTAHVFTAEQFDQLMTGMTYSRAAAIMGAEGETLSEEDLDGYVVAVYQWTNNDGSTCNATFQNGRLISKSQFGLK